MQSPESNLYFTLGNWVTSSSRSNHGSQWIAGDVETGTVELACVVDSAHWFILLSQSLFSTFAVISKVHDLCLDLCSMHIYIWLCVSLIPHFVPSVGN